MTKQELYKLLQNPQQIEASHIPTLENLIQSYPYSASFIFLYLYGLAKTEDVRYSVELKRYVAYLPHRERLYEMLSGLNANKESDALQVSSDEGFYLIDSFLADARSSGEDLPTELRFDVGEGADYFTTSQLEEASEVEVTEEVATPTPIAPQLAEAETTDESELFTETLAKIYVQQGKYERALSIIRSLHLHYPQKNRYFADQIRYLERIVSSNIDKK